MEGPRYIVVEGPIGVGKTTLARLVAGEFNARVVLEQVEENPFIKKFYDEPGMYAFQTQIYFLLSRYRQQRQLAQQDLFNQSTVIDYLFAKDQIFAQANLEGDELALYRQLFSLLDARLPKPDLVVYLEARSDVSVGALAKAKPGLRATHFTRVRTAHRGGLSRLFLFLRRDAPAGGQ